METKEFRRVILVVQSGWVIFAHQSKADPTLVRNARVIQRWGTTEGLAQLANHGPQPETTLSAQFDGEVPAASVLFTMKVSDDAKWPE